MTVLREDNLFTEQTQVSENCFLALVDNALVRISYTYQQMSKTKKLAPHEEANSLCVARAF